MEKFIKSLISIDDEILNGIKQKIKKNKKLEDYQIFYLIETKKSLERYKKIKNEV